MRGDRLRLLDVLEAIAVIQRDTPLTRQALDTDTPIRSHILLHIQIIGEAASKISEALRDHRSKRYWLLYPQNQIREPDLMNPQSPG